LDSQREVCNTGNMQELCLRRSCRTVSVPFGAASIRRTGRNYLSILRIYWADLCQLCSIQTNQEQGFIALFCLKNPLLAIIGTGGFYE
jgi:hypothetical protein